MKKKLLWVLVALTSVMYSCQKSEQSLIEDVTETTSRLERNLTLSVSVPVAGWIGGAVAIISGAALGAAIC